MEAPTAVLMAQSAAGCFFLNPELAALEVFCTGTLVQEAPTAVLMAQNAAGCFFLNPELAAL